MDSEHDIPLLVVDLVEHTIKGETSVVDNVVQFAKGPGELLLQPWYGLARSEEQMYILYGLFDQAFSELGVHDVARNSDSLAASGVDVSSNLLGLLCCHMHVLIEILQGLCYARSRTASSLPASISVTVTIAPSRAKSSAQLLPIPWLLCMNRRMH